MRSARRPIAVVLVAAVVLSAGMVGCGSDGLAPDERAVCDALQAIADELAAGEGPDALAGLDELATSVAATDNEELRSGGEQFLDAISEPVDVGSLTVEESVALGDQVLADGGAGLEAMGQECERLGDPVEVDAVQPAAA